MLTVDGDSKDFVLNKSDFDRIAAHVKELIVCRNIISLRIQLLQ
ncbi:hypothetical protein LRN57_14300, partial [Staphylococcus aureus]|nr:hypothetical protein [Staphylococcus aureus]